MENLQLKTEGHAKEVEAEKVLVSVDKKERGNVAEAAKTKLVA